MEYSAQFTFREEWWDARLAYERFADQNTEVYKKIYIYFIMFFYIYYLFYLIGAAFRCFSNK